MITLELLVLSSQPAALRALGSHLGLEVDPSNISDRSPSLWQKEIIDKNQGTLIHVFDRGFIGVQEHRWLHEDVVDEDWESFKFSYELEVPFLKLLLSCINSSQQKKIWLMTDAQFGPDKKIIAPQTYLDFRDTYSKSGMPINAATLIHG